MSNVKPYLPATSVLRQKGKIPVEEEGFKMPTLKKTSRMSREMEEEQETVSLKKVPGFPSEDLPPETKPPQKLTMTTVYDVEERVYEEAEMLTARHYEIEQPTQKEKTIKKPDVVPSKDKTVELKESKQDTYTPRKGTPKDEKVEDKMALKKTPKDRKEEAVPQPSQALKKVSKLPSDEKEQETVKLKPFKTPTKPGVAETVKDKKDKEFIDTQWDKTPRERETKEPGDHEKVKIVPTDKEEQSMAKKPVDKARKSSEQDLSSDKLQPKGKRIPTPEEDKESIKLKPFSKTSKGDDKDEKTPSKPEERKPTPPGKVLSRTPKDETPTEASVKKYDSQEAQDKEPKKVEKAETTPDEKPSPTKPLAVKKVDKSPEEGKPMQLKKAGPPSIASEEKEGKPLKPVEHLKKGLELKKTPSPKVEKPKTKAVESIPAEKRPSGDISKRIPKQVSPKDSFEAVTLKKVPKKPSPQEETTAPVEPEKTGKAKIPMMKELSPQAVQLRKISTQLEEEVDEEEPEVEEEEEDEAWGWELVPSESYGSED